MQGVCVYAQELTTITEFCIKYFRTFDWFITLTVVGCVFKYVCVLFCLSTFTYDEQNHQELYRVRENENDLAFWQLFEFQTILFIITSAKSFACEVE